MKRHRVWYLNINYYHQAFDRNFIKNKREKIENMIK